MTEDIYDRIKRHEGFCFTPKPDDAFKGGSFVIGWGHDITPEQAHDYANGISQDEATALLTDDVAKCRAELAQDLPWTAELSSLRQDLLCEMVFQLGINGLLGFHNLLFCARSGDADGVAHAMLDSKWHLETPERCEEMSNLWLNGDVDGTGNPV